MSDFFVDDFLDDFFGPPPQLLPKEDQIPDKPSTTTTSSLNISDTNENDHVLEFMDQLELVFSSDDDSESSQAEIDDDAFSESSSGKSSASRNSFSSTNSRNKKSNNTSPIHQHSQHDNCRCTVSPICGQVKTKKGKNQIKLKSTKSEFKESKAASDLKHYVYSAPIMNLSSMQCNPLKCEHEGMCVQLTTIGEAISLRKNFWGMENQAAFTHTQRREKARQLLEQAYSRNENKFVFKIGSRYVCERGYLTILGILSRPDSRIAGSWLRTKAAVQTSPDDLKIMTENAKLSKSARRNRSKFANATAYIEHMALFFGDTLPTAGQEKVRALPYEDVSKFFEEYKYHCKTHGEHPGNVARKTTFHKAFTAKKDIRLLGCKGSFETCDICNHANDMLRDTGHHYTREQREIVLRFKRLHLEQQARERQHLENNKLKCHTEYDKTTGDPLHALIFSDGMTAMRGETPKFGRKTHAKGDKGKKIQNRVIGVEVHCGPVTEVFLYHTDDFVRSGGNIMIEVQRQAMIDLGAILNTEHNMALPRHIMFQFDNCGENKNKEMFGFFSLLIETGVLDQIDVNFMIVGHTHCSIDQYFSTLSSSIEDSDFIGSPASLWNLFETAHSSEYAHKRPKIQRQIRVVYDMGAALAPYLTNGLKYYQTPFNFKFTRVCGKAVMQYKLFSSFETWLPRPPDGVMQTADDLFNNRVHEIALHRLATVGGQEAMLSTIDVSTKMTASKLFDNSAINNNFNTLKLMVPDLFRMEERALENQQQRMRDEALDLTASERLQTIQPRYAHNPADLATIQRALAHSDDKQRGYLIWLDSLHSRAADQVPLDLFSPRPLSPAKLLEQLLAQVPAAAVEVAEDSDCDDNSDDEADEDEAAPTKRRFKYKISPDCRRMFTAARAISASALNVIKMTGIQPGEGRLTVSHLDAYTHTSLCLAASEFAYYKEMSNVVNVVKALHAEYEHAPKWEPLPATHMSASYQATCAERRQQIEKEMTCMVALAQKLLQKKGHDVDQDTDFLVRSKEHAAEIKKARTALKLATAAASAAVNNSSSSSAAVSTDTATNKRKSSAAAASNKRKPSAAAASTTNKRVAPSATTVTTTNSSSAAEVNRASLDALCSCVECTDPVVERCLLCGYCVCHLHRNCPDSHSHQLKRTGATRNGSAVPTSEAMDIVAVEAPSSPVLAAQPEVADPVSVAQPEAPEVSTAQPAATDIAQQSAVTAAAADPVSVAQPDGSVTAEPDPVVSVPSKTTSSSSSRGGGSPVERLQSFVGTWPEDSTTAAKNLFDLIVRAVVGEAKKTKGGAFQARLEEELHFPQYMKGNQLSFVAMYCGIDMPTSGAGDPSINKKDWYKFKDQFVREFLKKFGFV